jgi:hypothetical protein
MVDSFREAPPRWRLLVRPVETARVPTDPKNCAGCSGRPRDDCKLTMRLLNTSLAGLKALLSAESTQIPYALGWSAGVMGLPFANGHYLASRDLVLAVVTA